LAGADVRIDGRFESDGTGPLLGLIGLDRVVAADSKPARLDVSANGPLGRELRLEAKLAAGPIDAGGKGTLRFASDQPATLDFDQFAGMIGGNNVKGRWALRFEDVVGIDGSIEAESLDAPAVVAAAIGVPLRSGAGATGWSPDPIAWSATGLNGRIAFKAQRAVFAPWLVAQGLSGAVRFNGSEILFEDIAGELGKGRLDGRLTVANGAAGLTAKLRLGLAGAELGSIFPSTDRPVTSGRLALQTEIEGVGRSPAAFIGSLTGFGNVTLEQARLVGLNPEVFGAVTRAVELGIPTEGNRIREFIGGALDNAGLPVAKASAALSIGAGQARLRDIVIKADGADLQANVNVDLSNAMLDALLTLNAPPSAPGGVRPAVLVALQGTLPAPKRSLDINLLTTWLTLRAVEQQSKQIEAMERAAREAAAAAAAAAPPPPKAVEPPELPAAAPSLAPEAAPTPPASAPNAAGGVSGEMAAPPLPPPVTVLPKPRAAPRAETAAPRAESVAPAPARAPAAPPLLGSEN
jgi:large subunit ribosomal protein L24